MAAEVEANGEFRPTEDAPQEAGDLFLEAGGDGVNDALVGEAAEVAEAAASIPCSCISTLTMCSSIPSSSDLSLLK